MNPEVYPGKATTPYFLMRLSIWRRTPVVFDGFPRKNIATCRGGEGHGTAQVVPCQAQRARTLAGESDMGAAGRKAASLEGKRSFDRGSLGNAESVLEKTELKHSIAMEPVSPPSSPHHLLHGERPVRELRGRGRVCAC